MSRPRSEHLPTFLGSDRALARYLARPIADFLHIEAAGGILLLAGTVAALVWANSPWEASYGSFWETKVNLDVGGFALHEDLRHLVNDGLMALFFFVVGLEIKREMVTGELREPRSAALPAVAALGGMIAPALLYAALNAGGEGSAGWGIPMATDIAFALGVVSLMGNRVPASLKLFLLTLAIVDDIGAITVIAVFYTESLSFGWLGLATGGVALTAVLRRLRVWYAPTYVIVGVFVWLATLESGVHATLAGVVLGLMTPARPLQGPQDTEAIIDELETEAEVENLDASEVRTTAFLLRESVSVGERAEHALHPWTSYVIVPLFALANAGIPLSGEVLGDAAGSAVTLGVVLGLVVGKVVGIVVPTALAVRAGLAPLPRGMNGRHLVGVGFVAGIGFTVSLFIATLAFDPGTVQEEAKIGILAASVVAALAGTAVLARGRPAPQDLPGDHEGGNGPPEGVSPESGTTRSSAGDRPPGG